MARERLFTLKGEINELAIRKQVIEKELKQLENELKEQTDE